MSDSPKIPKIPESFTPFTWFEIQGKFCLSTKPDNCSEILCSECIFDAEAIEEFKIFYKGFIGERYD